MLVYVENEEKVAALSSEVDEHGTALAAALNREAALLLQLDVANKAALAIQVCTHPSPCCCVLHKRGCGSLTTGTGLGQRFPSVSAPWCLYLAEHPRICKPALHAGGS